MDPNPDRGRLTPREALADFLAIIGEREFSAEMRAAVGEPAPGDLRPGEVQRFRATLHAHGLAEVVPSILLCAREVATRAGERPILVLGRKGMRVQCATIEGADAPTRGVRARIDATIGRDVIRADVRPIVEHRRPKPGHTGRPKRQAFASIIGWTLRELTRAASRTLRDVYPNLPAGVQWKLRNARTMDEPRGEVDGAKRALALLLLLHGADRLRVFGGHRAPEGRARVRWLVRKLASIVEDRTGSYAERRAKR